MTQKSKLLLQVDNLRKHLPLLQQAVTAFQAGSLVAFPSECGYMIGARADDEASLRKLFEATRRSLGRPLTLYFPDMTSAQPWIKDPIPTAQRLMEFFFPGPLTLLLPRSELVHALVRAELDKVAIRVPHHPLAQEFLRQTGALAAVSARRRPTEPRLKDAQGVIEHHGANLAAVLEWREPTLGLEPTVVDACRDPVRILSCGFISPHDLGMALPSAPILSGDGPTPRRFERYLPQTRIIVVEGETERVPRRLKTLIDSFSSNEKVALLVTQETADGAFSPPPRVAHFSALGSREDPETLERNLVEVLKRLEDEKRAAVILIEGIPRVGAGAALMDRLCQDAHQVVNTDDPGYSGQAGLRRRERDDP